MGDSLTTYDKLNEDIQFTEDETRELLNLSEKEILVLILSELKKITADKNSEKFQWSRANYMAWCEHSTRDWEILND